MSGCTVFTFKDAFNAARASYQCQFGAEIKGFEDLGFERNSQGQVLIDLTDRERMYQVALNLHATRLYFKIDQCVKAFFAELNVPALSARIREGLCNDATYVIANALQDANILSLYEVQEEIPGARYLLEERAQPALEFSPLYHVYCFMPQQSEQEV